MSDFTWSCGPNGVGPGNPNPNPSGKGKSLDAREEDEEWYDPGQGYNQPQGFFGGCNGKREVDEKVNINIEIPDDERYDPGQGCNQPQSFFDGCNGKFTTKREEMFEKVVRKSADDEKMDVNFEDDDAKHYDPSQGCNQTQGFFGGCNGKSASGEKQKKETVKVREGLSYDGAKKDIDGGPNDENYDPGQGCNQPQGFFGGRNGK